VRIVSKILFPHRMIVEAYLIEAFLSHDHGVLRFPSCSSPQQAGDDKQHSVLASERKINTVYEHDHADYIPMLSTSL